MPDTLFSGLTLADIHQDLTRNIVSLRVSEDLFDDLTESRAGWNAAIELELATKPYAYQSNQPIIDRPFEEAIYIEAIDFPFKNWSRSRYSDGSFGVWYGADTLETTVYETVHHWREGLLRDAGWDKIDGVAAERKVYDVRCDAAILDFRPKIDEIPGLVDPNDYRYCQQVGTRIVRESHPGLVSQSARCTGDIFAIFNSRVLSNPQPRCYLTYRIVADHVVVEREPSATLLTL